MRIELFLIAFAYGTDCPSFLCSNSTSNTCLKRKDIQQSNSIHYEYTQSYCKSGEFCQTYGQYNIKYIQELECKQGLPATNTDTTCRTYKKVGEKCNTFDCGPIFYCDKHTQTCKKKAKYSEQCSQPDQCYMGLICNFGQCIPQFTIASGNNAEHPLACQSNILRRGKCQAESSSPRQLPMLCNQDSDCISTSGEQGKCECGWNSKGNSYCRLFESDDIVKQSAKAVLEGRYHEGQYLVSKASLWPLIADYESCYGQQQENLIVYEAAKHKAEKCGSCELMLTFILLGILV